METSGRGRLQVEATYKADITSIAEYLKTKYREDQFVNIVKSHESNHPNTNSTIKRAAEFAEELNQSNEMSDPIKEGIQRTKAGRRESVKRK
jgi:hypothetical protein